MARARDRGGRGRDARLRPCHERRERRGHGVGAAGERRVREKGAVDVHVEVLREAEREESAADANQGGCCRVHLGPG